MAFRKEVERNLNVCPKCGYHFRVTVPQRLSISVDRGTWRELMVEMAIGDPLGFVDSRPYPKRMEQARANSGRNDAVVVGIGKIENRPVAIGVMDFEFMGGSMGVVVGEKLARLFDIACERKLPVIIFVASGRRADAGRSAVADADGEGIFGDRAISRRAPAVHFRAVRSDDRRRGGVVRDAWRFEYLRAGRADRFRGPAGDGADQQSGAARRFPARRVPPAHGMLDAIVPRHQMRFTLSRILAMLTKPRGNRGAGQGAPKGKRRGVS